MFNIDRSLRGNITKHLNDSQNYILIETLKSCDQQGVEENEIWAVRERIAKVFRQINKRNLENAESSEDLAPPGEASDTDKGSGPKVA